MQKRLFEARQVGARHLAPADLPALNALFARCADYALLVGGEPPAPNAADGVSENRPATVAADDHFTIGLWGAENRLFGLIEALHGYPEPGTMYIGLMLLDPDYRGGGAGGAVHEAFSVWAQERGCTRLMLSIVEENRAAYRF